MESYMLRDIMISRLGQPVCNKSLDEYFALITTATIDSCYIEHHHILPRCLFPEYTNDSWNIVSLNIVDHKKAHMLLANAYPINQFIYPLRWMRDSEESYAVYIELKRIVVKSWWKKFKCTPQYDVWRKARSENTKRFMAHSPNAINIKDACDRKYTKEEQALYKSKGGKNVLRAKAQSLSLRKFYEDPVNRHLKSEESKLRWANCTSDYREAFSNKMDLVNKSEEKRLRAGKAIKNKWADPEFKRRQSESRARHNNELRQNGIKRANSNSMKEKWADPVWKAAELERRRLKRLEKLNETD